MLNRIYIIPHGDELIDMDTDEDRKMHEAIKKYSENDDSETLVVISPHGIVLDRDVGVIYSSKLSGAYRTKHHYIRKTYDNDLELADSIARSQHAQHLRCITLSGNVPCPLDFGTLIPLQFFKRKRVVAMGEPRLLDYSAIVGFADDLYSAMSKFERKISLIISADQAHTHSKDGPYGFSEDADLYDKIVIDSINNNDFHALINIDKSIVERAKPDSYQNMIVTARLLEISRRKMHVDYYYVAGYFGMLLAREA
ncbi:hypothetical protein [Thermoplasma volcanium GSS1]|uniref:Extradiol ring-cleavage dioxygenase class III enzyme subunit B domain-containing protein n=1 Tax=Thermoplasma volcanium (strain ATCC 51530 / DSM 4299 / JCM 9571 / NBRC 15438 / GSS1) TaxID=273116 RepID=Q978F2_THEVO|nr:hypothetical protein [Thermoplasma volcanium]BAB60607.1 hypothetical protein [Thermoplasma volcanium GSS1]